MEIVHSVKSRLKDPDHLADKLTRKLRDSLEKDHPFDYTPENLCTKINDLVGLRILHLHTRQMREIDSVLRSILDEKKYPIVEGPFARTWDDESVDYFTDIGIECEKSPSMYTSVHYVITSNSKTLLTAEIQVRTLSEEVWGEVDHKINYPHRTENLACREQIKVLARATSTATRLVDSIFATIAADGTPAGASPKVGVDTTKRLATPADAIDISAFG